MHLWRFQENKWKCIRQVRYETVMAEAQTPSYPSPTKLLRSSLTLAPRGTAQQLPMDGRRRPTRSSALNTQFSRQLWKEFLFVFNTWADRQHLGTDAIGSRSSARINSGPPRYENWLKEQTPKATSTPVSPPCLL